MLELTGIGLKRQLLWLVVGIVFMALTESLGFLLLMPLVRLASGEVMDHAGLLLGGFALLSAIRILVGYRQRVETARLQLDAKDALRLRAYGALLQAEWRWLARSRSEDHNQILINAIGQICGTGISQLLAFCAALCLIFAYLVAALLTSWQVTLVSIGAALLLGWMLRGRRQLAQDQGEALVQASRAMFRTLKGGLAQMRELKITEGEDRFLTEFRERNARFREQQFAFDQRHARVRVVMQLSLISMILVVTWLSVTWWKLGLAELVPALFLIVRIAPMLTNLQTQLEDWQRTVPLIAQTRQLITQSAAHAEATRHTDAEPMPLRRAISLEGVHVRYADREQEALSGLSLTIPANSTTFISGRSGSGKSTLGDVLMGLIAPDAGEIRIDGAALTGTARLRWRKSVGYVQQQPTLFDDTIRGNLLWGRPDATDDELCHVLRLAAADFVFELPLGLDTRVGEAGQQLSGGERQRIALARILLRRPALLILDEATSALDQENEAAISRAIAELAGRVTLVVISHRFGTGVQPDQHIVLQDGAVVAG